MTSKNNHAFAHGVTLNGIAKNPIALNADGTGPAVNYAITFVPMNGDMSEPQPVVVELNHAFFYNGDQENKTKKLIDDMLANKSGVTVVYHVPRAGVEKPLELQKVKSVFVTNHRTRDEVKKLNEEFFSRAESFTRRVAEELQGGPRF